MKVIVDIEKKILKMLENNRSIFKGEYNADKLELYINKQLENEYPVITGLLSNGRKIGGYTTDNSYETEVIDGVSYTKAEFTLSKENGFNLSEGLMQVTVWMYRTKDTVVVSKEAIGNITFTVVNTTAFNEGDIIISGDVEGAVVNLKVEVENLQQVIQLNNANINKLTNEMPLIVDETLLLPVNHTDIVVGYRNSIDLDSLNKIPVNGDKFWGICKTKDNFVYSFVAKCTGEITSSGDVDFAVFEFVELALLYDATINDSITNIEKSIPKKTSQLENDSGYVVEGLLSRYMTRDTTQTVSGNKIFEKPIYFWNESTYIQKPRGVAALEFYISDNLALSITKNRLNVYGTIGTESSYVSGIFGTNIKGKVIYQNNKQVANKEDIPTKLSQLENDTNYATQEDLNSAIEVAEGKTKTYVINASENSWFNSSGNEIITYDDNSLTTTSGEVIPFKNLKLGDIIYIVELDLPDRYVGVINSSLIRFYKMETSKVDLSGYATKTEVTTMIADYINSNFENGDEGSY